MLHYDWTRKGGQVKVPAKDYFRQLNIARSNVKHEGVFPDAKQWSRVGELVYSHISRWCEDYLEVPLDALDESALLGRDQVKACYSKANELFSKGGFKEVLEQLALGLYFVLKEKTALRGLRVGEARAEDAIKLSAFGVHANDFLAFQEFLPGVVEEGEGQIQFQWRQRRFGHPGNWQEHSARFCLNTFLDIVLKIQDAQWIPGAIEFLILYAHKVTAIRDEVEVWNLITEGDTVLERLVGANTRREVVRKLSTGEFLTGLVALERSRPRTFRDMGSAQPERPEVILIAPTKPGEIFRL